MMYDIDPRRATWGSSPQLGIKGTYKQWQLENKQGIIIAYYRGFIAATRDDGLHMNTLICACTYERSTWQQMLINALFFAKRGRVLHIGDEGTRGVLIKTMKRRDAPIEFKTHSQMSALVFFLPSLLPLFFLFFAPLVPITKNTRPGVKFQCPCELSA